MADPQRNGSALQGDRKGSVPFNGDRKESVVLGGERKGSVAFHEEHKESTSRKDSRKSVGSRRSSAGRRRSSMLAKPLELDDVLTNELGQFGRYQARSLLLVAIPIAMSAFMSEYIFSAAAIPHRCAIPECGEESKLSPFAPLWLAGARPAGAQCERYLPRGPNGTLAQCPAELFDPTVTVSCQSYVYERDDSVVYDFDLGCNEWLRALAGTLNSVGTLLVLPLTGWVSDRWGRRVALALSVLNMALVGALRAASPTYAVYLALQLLQTTLGAGLYSSAYVFVAELVGPQYRVVTSATASSMFAVGQVLLGALAWAVSSWRVLLLVLHVPCLLVVSYYWILNESVRWLLAQRRFPEAKAVLLEVARVNRTTISDKSLEALTNPTQAPVLDDKGEEVEDVGLVRGILRSRVLLRRVLTTPVWWIATTFVYYGLNINSTGLAGNMYANYMATCAVEVPGFFTAVLLLDRVGRRATLASTYLLCAACNFAFAFIAEELSSWRLALFLVGKFAISVAFTSVYLFTTELYPTRYRHSLLAFSSMLGRLGSITAPLTPPLREYWEGLPSVLFGCMGLLGGLLVLTQPETLGQRLPDTLQEAENIGRMRPQPLPLPLPLTARQR